MSKVLTDDKHYNDIADAIRDKNSKDDKYYPSDMAEAIRAISTGPEFPSLEVAAIYATGVRHCLANYYKDDFKDIMIMQWFGEVESYICVLFLTENFEILSFDSYTTEFTAIGWFSCVLTESTGEWTTVDYRSEESPGGNFVKHIVYASRYIEYGEQILYPVPVDTFIECTEVDFTNLTNGSFTQTLSTGETLTYSVTYDENGNPLTITNPIDNTTIVVGLE